MELARALLLGLETETEAETGRITKEAVAVERLGTTELEGDAVGRCSTLDEQEDEETGDDEDENEGVGGRESATLSK